MSLFPRFASVPAWALFLLGFAIPACAVATADSERPEEPYCYPACPAAADETVAYTWMAGSIVIPVIAGALMSVDRDLAAPGAFVFLAGITVGPSAGQFYAGSPGAALGGVILRAAGGIVLLVGVARKCYGCMSSAETAPQPDGTEPDGGRSDDGSFLVPAGLALYGVGALLSLIDTHYAVRRNHVEVTGRRAELAPILRISPGGGLACGAQARLQF